MDAPAPESESEAPHAVPIWAWVLVAVSGVASVLPMAAGLGARWGLWPFGIGFALLKVDVYLAVGAMVLAAVGFGLGLSRRFRPVLPAMTAALLVPLFPLATILSEYHDARTLPRIHDITTDFADPPGFYAVVHLRPPHANSLQYGGAEVAAQQAAAYPGIRTIHSRLAPDRAYELARSLAHAYGWNVVREDSQGGVIEAVDTTFWFGFQDDISIRIRPDTERGSLVDIRSVSRVGVSDVGTNARRIQRFMDDFRGG